MQKLRNFFTNPYNVLLVAYFYFLAFALIVDTPQEIYNGLKAIIVSRDVLITDYIAVGGVGATLFNSGLSGIFAVLFLRQLKLKPNGSIMMSIWLVTGFSFFGKNLFNMLPIILGGYLFSLYKKEPFMRYSLVTLLATALSPIVTEFVFYGSHQPSINLTLGILIGVTIGFILSPIALNAMKSHGGFNLYNVGFAAGITGIVINGILTSLGYTITPVLFWDTENRYTMMIFLIILLLYFLILGLTLGNNKKANLKKLFNSSGRLVSDYYLIHKEVVYINMAISCAFALLVILIMDAPINGPVLGATFTIIGFSCFGKHIVNMWPVVVGAFIGTYFSKWGLSDPGIILGILFSTALAPIAGTFGIIDGVIAGALHILLVTNTSSMHGGLNLYNNGFAAGIVAMIFVPLITTFRRGDYN